MKIGLTLGLGGLVFLITKRAVNSVRMNRIKEAINQGIGQYGDIRDYSSYFSKTYKDEIIAKYPKYNIAVLTPTATKEYANKLHDAFRGINDNSEIIDVFSKLRNGVFLSQVSSYYHALTGTTLLSEVQNMKDTYKKQVTDIIKNYQTFQII